MRRTHGPPGHGAPGQEVTPNRPAIGPRHGLEEKDTSPRSSVCYRDPVMWKPSHPNADADDREEVSNDDHDVRGVVDDDRDRWAGLHRLTETLKGVRSRLDPVGSLVCP